MAGGRTVSVRKHSLDDILSRSARAFHRSGFRATTLVDLLRETGIVRGALYFHFADKRTLFVAALRHHLQRIIRPCLDDLRQSPAPKADIVRLFDRLATGATASEHPSFSFLVCAGVEMGPHDREVRAIVSECDSEVTAVFAGCVRRSQGLGQSSPERDADKIAGGLLSLLQGIHVAARYAAVPSKETVTAIVLDLLR